MRDWRIKTIPFKDTYAMVEKNRGALFGAFLFIAGIFAGLKIKALFAISIAGLVIGLASIIFRGRIEIKNRIKVQAHVIDKEHRTVLGTPGLRGGARVCWAFQLLCEFAFNGKRFTVTPSGSSHLIL